MKTDGLPERQEQQPEEQPEEQLPALRELPARRLFDAISTRANRRRLPGRGKIVDVPKIQHAERHPRGYWSGFLDRVAALPRGKAIEIPLDMPANSAKVILLTTARKRGLNIRVVVNARFSKLTVWRTRGPERKSRR